MSTIIIDTTVGVEVIGSSRSYMERERSVFGVSLAQMDAIDAIAGYGKTNFGNADQPLIEAPDSPELRQYVAAQGWKIR